MRALAPEVSGVKALGKTARYVATEVATSEILRSFSREFLKSERAKAEDEVASRAQT
jgi:hypothetical protein